MFSHWNIPHSAHSRAIWYQRAIVLYLTSSDGNQLLYTAGAVLSNNTGASYHELVIEPRLHSQFCAGLCNDAPLAAVKLMLWRVHIHKMCYARFYCTTLLFSVCWKGQLVYFAVPPSQVSTLRGFALVLNILASLWFPHNDWLVLPAPH